MKNLVIAEFPAQEGKLEDLKNLMRQALGDTRAFDGCISIDVYIDDHSQTMHLIEDWESLDHYDKYLRWRLETGLEELVKPIVEGGLEGVRIIKCGKKENI